MLSGEFTTSPTQAHDNRVFTVDSAAKAGFSDPFIQMLRRRNSGAFTT